jgi:hypothetical protein
MASKATDHLTDGPVAPGSKRYWVFQKTKLLLLQDDDIGDSQFIPSIQTEFYFGRTAAERNLDSDK